MLHLEIRQTDHASWRAFEYAQIGAKNDNSFQTNWATTLVGRSYWKRFYGAHACPFFFSDRSAVRGNFFRKRELNALHPPSAAVARRENQGPLIDLSPSKHPDHTETQDRRI